MAGLVGAGRAGWRGGGGRCSRLQVDTEEDAQYEGCCGCLTYTQQTTCTYLWTIVKVCRLGVFKRLRVVAYAHTRHRVNRPYSNLHSFADRRALCD